ncbi:hypothetical protein [Frankia sp. ACN1ag]|uniref:hypothetical protein n=1 Tax=Frankia sp. ACN1ag TaxID=102891 RepID=UPI0006DC79AE|nr:hypothetical protein [Frankia sp. ACN1ag]KQC38088.1 hypothetical protein UK82_12250 [Frankia sp. ACN1ag]
MGKIADGVYRIRIDGRENLTLSSPDRNNIFLLPGEGPGQEWEIQQTGNGSNGNNTYTIRQASAPLFVGFDGSPDVFERVRPLPEAREWRIVDGPRPGTVTIGVVENDLTLGLHPALIFPPLVALSPVFDEDRGWSLQPAG